MSDPLAPLRIRFRARLAADRAELLILSDGVPGASELQRLIHGIAGAAGIFGFASLGREASRIDDLYAAGAAPDRAALDRLAEIMRVVADGEDA